VDLYKGMVNLIETYRELGGSAMAVKYEDLVTGEPEPWKRVFDYLGLSFDPAVLSNFSEVKIAGRMKDFTGITRHTSITDTNVQKWARTFRHPVRKRWARRYLSYLGAERLAVMGYRLADLSAALDRIGWTSRSVLLDLAYEAFGVVYLWTEPGIFRRKLKLLPHTQGVLKHG
jgi:hypothetical protein